MLNISRRAAGSTILALAAMVVAGNAADAQVKLQWKFKKGETLNYQMVQNMDMSTMAGDMKMKQTMDMAWNVKEVKSDGSAVLTQRITRIRMTMSGGFIGKIEYDSDKKNGGGGNPIADRLGKTMGALVNADFTLTMSPSGNITDMKLSEKAKAALKTAGGGAAGGLGGGLSEDTFKQMSTQMGAIFPKTAISKGKTWNHKQEVKMPFGELKTDMNFKYAGMDSISGKKVARIELDAKVSITPKAGFPGKIDIKDKGTSGKSYFDVEKGRLVSSTMSQNMDMVIMAGGQNITTGVKSTTEMKLKK